jgi:ribosomal protein S18 acetylase RimI-like enzyme
MDLELTSISGYGLEETVTLLNQGFADYFVPIEFNTAALLNMLVHDGIDSTSSRIVSRGGEGVGVALIARRGWSSRLAGMAIVPAARRAGVGTWLMAQLLAQAKARGERRMVLEVIEQNTAAVRLYEGCGFRVLRRLVSLTASQPEIETEVQLEEVDVREAARLATAHGLLDLPWQISGESLACLGLPNRAYRRGAAYVVISNPDAPRIGIRCLVVEPPARRQGQATRLLQAVLAHHPGKEWSVPALCPEEIRSVFEKVGFVRGELSQLQMVTEWG